jgi:hypothetical protein
MRKKIGLTREEEWERSEVKIDWKNILLSSSSSSTVH